MSRSWKNLLTTRDKTIQSLWRVQCFNRCAKPVRPARLQQYAKYADSQVTQLIIRDCRQFGLDADTFRLIAAYYHSLKVLKLQESGGDIKLQKIGRPLSPCVPQLTSLYLGFYTPFMREFVHKIVASSAATLQELTILNLPGRPARDAEDAATAHWPILQNLRTLRLGSSPYSSKASPDMVSASHLELELISSQSSSLRLYARLRTWKRSGWRASSPGSRRRPE